MKNTPKDPIIKQAEKYDIHSNVANVCSTELRRIIYRTTKIIAGTIAEII